MNLSHLLSRPWSGKSLFPGIHHVSFTPASHIMLIALQAVIVAGPSAQPLCPTVYRFDGYDDVKSRVLSTSLRVLSSDCLSTPGALLVKAAPRIMGRHRSRSRDRSPTHHGSRKRSRSISRERQHSKHHHRDKRRSGSQDRQERRHRSRSPAGAGSGYAACCKLFVTGPGVHRQDICQLF